jgi:hypothetical protein
VPQEGLGERGGKGRSTSPSCLRGCERAQLVTDRIHHRAIVSRRCGSFSNSRLPHPAIDEVSVLCAAVLQALKPVLT